MCGIIGYVGRQAVVPLLVEGLKRLEYRGYDSAGLAVVSNGAIRVERKKGKIVELERAVSGKSIPGTLGLGHTRWATHGKPSDENAHPHFSNRVAVVHNGIIENFVELRKELQSKGYEFTSETDTEVMVHLVDSYLSKNKDLVEAVKAALKRLRGAYAFGILSHSQPDMLIGARCGSPLIVGLSPNGNFIASDIPAVLPYTREVIILEEGEMAVLKRDSVQIFDAGGSPVSRAPITISWDPVSAEKGGYKHFMLKEIIEQPRAVADTLRGRLRPDESVLYLEDLPADLLTNTRYVKILACGTSSHAGLIGKFWLENLADIPASVEIASEFRSKTVPLPPDTLVIAVSQSGETFDTLAAAKLAKEKGTRLLAISNVLGSSIPRLSDGVLYTRAGPEICVLGTKTFTATLAALALLALKCAQLKGTLTGTEFDSLKQSLLQIPRLMEKTLSPARLKAIESLARRYAKKTNALYLARGANFPIAYEGALKLKEVSYIHAEGYAAGEMKHGPIALVDEHMLNVFIAPNDLAFEKVQGNIQEVLARNGEIVLVSSEDVEPPKGVAVTLTVPVAHPLLYPFLTVLPLQLFAYHIACERGLDVDQPRNLAKTVTVE
ncbi:MAG: glutamine--fructose-6-phosphate transaminase (isomerizing) [bacterium]